MERKTSECRNVIRLSVNLNFIILTTLYHKLLTYPIRLTYTLKNILIILTTIEHLNSILIIFLELTTIEHLNSILIICL